MTLIDYFEDDLQGVKFERQRRTIILYWKRAIEQTLYDRALSASAYPHPRKSYYVERWLPFWLSVTDDELATTLNRVNDLLHPL